MMQNAENIDVTVIIPSYNQKAVIFDALETVSRQETEFKYNVIVVESSGDDTAIQIKQRYPDISVIELKKRAYPGTARNAAIRKARGKYIAFTDTDCLVDRHWLQRLIQAHQDGYRVVGGSVLNGTPKSIVGTLDYLLEFSELLTKKRNYKSHFGTCNVSFQKEIFDEYGFFADQVKGSDSIYMRLMNRQGEILLHEPKAIIWHRNRTSLKKVIRNQYELGFGAAVNRYRYRLGGRLFVKYPFLIPFLPLAKMVAISRRLLRDSPVNFIKFILLSPLAFVVLCCYTAGFYRGRKFSIKKNIDC